MLFEECSFFGKMEYLDNVREQIEASVKELEVYPVLSKIAVYDYITLLVNTSEFDPVSKKFYDKNHIAETDIELLSNVACEYILEHLEEFQKR